jgi:hypothetical protein
MCGRNDEDLDRVAVIAIMIDEYSVLLSIS